MSGITYMDSGVIYYDDYLLRYFDMESGLSTVICFDPSCKHEKPTRDKNSDCTAVIYGMNINSLAYIGDRLYFSYGELGKEEKIKEFENCYFLGDFNDTGVLYTKCTGNAAELHNYSFDGEDQTIAQGESLSNYFYFDDQQITRSILAVQTKVQTLMG